jgi:YD repeat-containing protein
MLTLEGYQDLGLGVVVERDDGDAFIVGFTYDGMGRRTQEITLDGEGNQIVRDLYYSTNWQILDETVTTGGTTKDDTRNVWSPVYVNALLLRDRSSSGDGDLTEERLYFTSDANYDVTSVISTAGAVQEHVIYTAYGIATFTNSSWSSSADTLAVRTGWQGGESMPWIVGWSFQNRIELANLNVWMTAEPSMGGYVDGMNLYESDGDNPINGLDPTGLATIGGKPAIGVKLAYEFMNTSTVGWTPHDKHLMQKTIDIETSYGVVFVKNFGDVMTDIYQYVLLAPLPGSSKCQMGISDLTLSGHGAEGFLELGSVYLTPGHFVEVNDRAITKDSDADFKDDRAKLLLFFKSVAPMLCDNATIHLTGCGVGGGTQGPILVATLVSHFHSLGKDITVDANTDEGTWHPVGGFWGGPLIIGNQYGVSEPGGAAPAATSDASSDWAGMGM